MAYDFNCITIKPIKLSFSNQVKYCNICILNSDWPQYSHLYSAKTVY